MVCARKLHPQAEMDSCPCIVIVDSNSDDDELPPLKKTLSDYRNFEATAAGNPHVTNTTLGHSTSTSSRRCLGDIAQDRTTATSKLDQRTAMDVINLISDDDDEFDMQTVIAASLQNFVSPPTSMGCQDKKSVLEVGHDADHRHLVGEKNERPEDEDKDTLVLLVNERCVGEEKDTLTFESSVGGEDTSGNQRWDGGEKKALRQNGEKTTSGKTWSQRRAERAALKAPSKPLDCVGSAAQDSADDSDTLPDLDDFLPHHNAAQQPRRVTPKKPPGLDSSRSTRQERHYSDGLNSGHKFHRTTDSHIDRLSTGQSSSGGGHRQRAGAKRRLSVQASGSGSRQCGQSQQSAGQGLTEGGQSMRRKDRISQELQAGSSPLGHQDYDVFKFPPDSGGSGGANSSGDRRDWRASEWDSKVLRNKQSGVSFLQEVSALPGAVDQMTAGPFSDTEDHCLRDLLDELPDPNHSSCCLDLFEAFSQYRTPLPHLMDKVLENGFFRALTEDGLWKVHHFVLRMWQRFPGLVKIDVDRVLTCGDVLQKTLQSSLSTQQGGGSGGVEDGVGGGMRGVGASGRGSSGQPSVLQSRLYFQLLERGLQLGLSHSTLADQTSVNRSQAYACLWVEGWRRLVKRMTQWLEVCVVSCGSHGDSSAGLLARQWLCQLQALLGAAVLVSRDRQEAAKSLAPDLKQTYKYLSDLSMKRRLLHSLACPLLTFCLVRLVMEDQCHSTILSSQFPSSICEVVHNYYMALPPLDHLTPPPSPSDDGQDGGGGVAGVRGYSPQSCEELAMLVFFVTKSYLACKQRRLHSDLRQQVLKGPSSRLMTGEQRELFQQHVQDFRAHLLTLCPQLSSSTLTYLSLLQCLALPPSPS